MTSSVGSPPYFPLVKATILNLIDGNCDIFIDGFGGLVILILHFIDGITCIYIDGLCWMCVSIDGFSGI